MTAISFTAKPRSTSGRREASRLRAKGKLPASVYGRGQKPLSVEVDDHEMTLVYKRTIGKNALLTMKLEGSPDQTVMIKEVQREPVKDRFLHLDFYHVDPAFPLKLRVPVALEGVPVGVREAGGILDHPTRTVRVKCLPRDIPAEIKVDVSHLKIDESLRLEGVTPPPGVTFLSSKTTVLAHVSEVEEEKAPEPGTAPVSAAGTPEVLKEKKEGEEAAAEASPAKPGDAKAAPGKAAPAAGKAAPAAAGKAAPAPAAKPAEKKK